MSAVVAIPSVALLAGCALGLLGPSFPLFIDHIALIASAAGALWAWSQERPRLLAAMVSTGFLAGGTLLGVEAWQQAWRPTLRLAFEQLARAERSDAEGQGRRLPEDVTVAAALTGVLRTDAAPTAAGVSLSLEVREIGMPCPRPVSGGVLLTVSGESARDRLAEWRAGRVVRTTAQLRRPSRYLNPGVPDEERLLARRGTTLVGSVKSGALVEVVAHGGSLAETASAIRAFVRYSVGEAVGGWSPRAAGIVTAIIIGDRAGLDDETERRLQEAGTYHVIAISGGNIAILAGMTVGAFRIAGLLGRTAMLSAIAGLIAYGYLVAGGASVDRATLMAVVYFAGRALDLRGPPSNALLLVAGLLAAADPAAVADPGFLLTFGATAGILMAAPVVPLDRLPRLVAPFALMLAASAAAEAALAPVSAFIFARVTFAGLVLNFAAIPLMAVAQVAGMALVPVALVSAELAALIGWVAHAGAEGLVRSADLVRFAPFLTWRVAPPGWTFVVLYYAAIAVAWMVRPWRMAAALCAVLAAVWMVAEPWRWAAARGDGQLHVTFIDVGQGDSTLVRFPQGSTLVIDAGGLSGVSTFDVGDRVVAPVLRHHGIHRLQWIVLTHGDADHIGGARSIAREFRPADVWEGIPVPPFEPLRALKAIAAAQRARWTNVQAADVTTIDDVTVIVRHPKLADWERQDVRNDDSIVLELLWRDVSVVLTGDIGREVEAEIAPLFSPARMRIMKIPHHGSLTSSTRAFVEALAPRVAVVSAGRSNAFGHPAPVVLDRYRQAGAEVFRTDRDGAVTVDTDGRSVTVETFTGRTFAAR